MSLIHVSFFSKNLSRNVFYNAIIPKSSVPLKTLYLLHGWSGNHDDWITNTNIVELAERYRIAIILPNGENSFYTDFSEAESYGKMIAEDLIFESRHTFKLSECPADTWIAGLSMGGYGALRLGLTYPHQFSKISALSSRIIAKGIDGLHYDDYNQLPITIKNIFIRKTPEAIKEEMDLITLVENCQLMPQIDLFCGTEDDFYPINVSFYQWLKEKTPTVRFFSDTGDHDWKYWNSVIESVIQNMVEANV
ncbi:alpha/beta hydrolase [Tuanshanicoccus lijuaniae]|uniref:alpha/beta hydrolase n=1 Tax=Aerococcaceae bacterium zg-1292 TaxID=2774330 RepID=UPI001BD87871|nr:hypothetical protein [Aerococcaceae bacterium zg-A91]MBS4458484.1 hypothetical protein [Aerococcaceae bacterium zg-BR33]